LLLLKECISETLGPDSRFSTRRSQSPARGVP
jgi:hypothetical protein